MLKTPTVGPDEEKNAEMHDMMRRLGIGAALTLPVMVLAMVHLIPAFAHLSWMDGAALRLRKAGL